MLKQKQIEQIIKEFFEKIDPGISLSEIEIKDNVVSFQAETETPEILIGKNGQTLMEIHHILTRMLNKQIEDKIFIDLDINEYKKKKISFLKEMAQKAADEAVMLKRERELSPMNAFERRLIHLSLSERKDVQTESIGEGLDRRIVIKPVS